MIDWVKRHPILAAISGLALFLLFYLMFRGGGSEQVVVAGGAQSDPAAVAAGMQLQELQFSLMAGQQQAATVAALESDRNATELALAQIASQTQLSQSELAAQIASAQIAAQQQSEELSSTLAAQITGAQIQAQTQIAQLQFASTEAIEASRNELQKQIVDAQTAQNATNAALYADIFAQQQATQQQLIQSNQAVAQSQIKASSKRSLCYITTAACDVMGKADDCHELRTLRAFRDEWLVRQPGGGEAIAIYYKHANAVLGSLDKSPHRSDDLRRCWYAYIMPCVKLIEMHDHDSCFELYVKMLEWIGRKHEAELMADINDWRVRYRQPILSAA